MRPALANQSFERIRLQGVQSLEFCTVQGMQGLKQAAFIFGPSLHMQEDSWV